MKTKLLRKVRKRYSIIYKLHEKFYPEIVGGTWECLIVQDRKCEWRDKYIFISQAPFLSDTVCHTKQEAFKKALGYVQDRIVRDYSKYGTRRNKLYNKQEKLWYV